jgi:hypothetical protein
VMFFALATSSATLRLCSTSFIRMNSHCLRWLFEGALSPASRTLSSFSFFPRVLTGTLLHFFFC